MPSKTGRGIFERSGAAEVAAEGEAEEELPREGRGRRKVEQQRLPTRRSGAGRPGGVACLAAYIAVEQHQKSSARLGALSGLQMLGVLLTLHLVYVMIYPVHAGHEAPYWFMGAMSGWLIGRYARGHEEVSMPKMFVWRVLTATLLTGVSFVLLTVLSRLPGYLAEDDPLLHYGSGVLFGIVITGLFPLLLAQAMQVFDKRAVKPS